MSKYITAVKISPTPYTQILFSGNKSNEGSKIRPGWSRMDQEKFQKTYGVDKMVLKSKKIVLHCLKGKRAFDAADKLALLGYDDVYVYKV